MKKIILSQFVILLAGTVFAWYNFSRELISWRASGTCTLGCSANPATLTNPFYTPCFYGAIFFTLAFALSVILVLKVSKPRV